MFVFADSPPCSPAIKVKIPNNKSLCISIFVNSNHFFSCRLSLDKSNAMHAKSWPRSKASPKRNLSSPTRWNPIPMRWPHFD